MNAIERARQAGERRKALANVPSEASIIRAAKARLEALPRTVVRKTHGSKIRRSEPDLDIITEGRSVMIEVKRKGEKARPDQLARLRKYARAGARTAVCDDVEDIVRIVLQVAADQRDRRHPDAY